MIKILAVDDQKDNLVTIKAVLKNYIHNCEVITASSGTEGIEMAKMEQPDTILLDVIMPNMDGYEVCKILKAEEKTRHIPVIMITAIKTDIDSRIKGLECGADAFLSKPIDGIELTAQVKVMLRIKKAEEILRTENLMLEDRILERTKKLAESEEKLKLMVDNSRMGVSATDLKGYFIEVNKAFCNMLGYTSEELLYKHFNEISHPDDRKKNEDLYLKLLNGEVKYFDLEKRYVHKKGNIIDVLIRSQMAFNENGESLFEIAVAEDITARKQAEQDLLKNQYYLTKAQEIGNIGTWELDIINNILRWTEENYKIFGIPSGTEINIEKFFNTIHPDDLDLVNKRWNAALINEPYDIEHRIIVDNKVKWVREKADLEFDNQGKPVMAIGFTQDITERKNNEEKLKESELRLRQISDNSREWIWEIDENGLYTYVSPIIESLLEFKPDELVGKKYFYDLFVPEEREKLRTAAFSLIKQKKVFRDFVNRNVSKTGKLIWLSTSGVPILDNMGNLRGYRGADINITERVQFEKALKESEERYRNFISQVSEGVYRFELDEPMNLDLPVDMQVNYLYKHLVLAECNHAFMSMYDIKEPKEIIGKRQFELHGGRDNPNNRKAMEEFITSQYRSKNVITEEPDSKGNIRTFSNNAVGMVENNQLVRMWGTQIDITEQRRAEKIQKVLFNIAKAVIGTDNLNTLISLIQKELKAIIDTTNFYIALYNSQTDSLDLPFFADENDRLTSIPAGKTLTKYVLKTKKSLLATSELIAKLEKAGEVELKGTDSKIWLGVPLAVDGNVTGVIAVQSYTDEHAFDKTDMEMLEFVSDQIGQSIHRKKTDNDLLFALEKATESDRLKTAFLANMSHEIRTPMNGILGFSELLKQPDLSGSQQAKYIEIIEKSGERLLNIINDLVDISKIEAGQAEVTISEVDLGRQKEYLHSFFTPEAEKKGLRLIVKNPPSATPEIIFSDREKLYAILINLIKNAIKYTKKGTIEFGYEKVENDILFFVKDTGIGIPKDRSVAIFNRFVQADIEDKQAMEGAGLGLAICKAYVEMLDGQIWVESEPEKGSAFYFRIPLIKEKAEYKVKKERVETTPASEISRKLKVLIAEDEENARLYLSLVIKEYCSEILYSQTGIETIDICRNNPDIDLILMDIKMPGMNGYDATLKIREFNKNVVIIAQTAYAIAGDKEKALKAGCNDYIPKPINKNLLADKIKSFILN